MSHFFVSIVIAQVFNCFGAISYCVHDFFSMCDGGSGELLVVEIDGVCETFSVGGFYVASMCAIVFW